MISEEQIEKAAMENSRKLFGVSRPDLYGDTSHDRFAEGAKWAQDKMSAKHINGFESWARDYFSASNDEDLSEMLTAQEITEDELRDAYQAVPDEAGKEIAKYKELLEAKDAWIEELETRLNKMPTVDGYRITMQQIAELEKRILETNDAGLELAVECERQKKEIAELKKQLHQQRFNNEHNLSIDQKVADEIAELKEDIEYATRACLDPRPYDSYLFSRLRDIRRKYGMEG